MVFIHDPRPEVIIPVDEVNEESRITMENPQSSNLNNSSLEEPKKVMEKPESSNANNIKSEESSITMENPQSSNLNSSSLEGDSASTNNMVNHHSKGKGKNIMENPHSSKVENIILNHDFSEEVLEEYWTVTSKGGGRVVPYKSKYLDDILPYSGVNYLVISRRTSKFAGLEQDITKRFSEIVTYKFSAWVRLYGGSLGAKDEVEVLARLRFDYSTEIEDSKWCVLASEYLSKDDGWKNLVGSYKFEFKKSPIGVLFFFEGSEAGVGVDLLINSVEMSPSV